MLATSLVVTVLAAWAALLVLVGAWLLVAGELRHRRRASRTESAVAQERRTGMDQRQGLRDRRLSATGAPPSGRERRRGPRDRRTGVDRRRLAPLITIPSH